MVFTQYLWPEALGHCKSHRDLYLSWCMRTYQTPLTNYDGAIAVANFRQNLVHQKLLTMEYPEQLTS